MATEQSMHAFKTEVGLQSVHIKCYQKTTCIIYYTRLFSIVIFMQNVITVHKDLKKIRLVCKNSSKVLADCKGID